MTPHLLVTELDSLDLATALNRVAIGLLVVAAAWAGLVAALASWGPTVRWARALTPRVLRAALFATVSGSLAISPAQGASDLDGLPLPSRGVTGKPTTALAGDHHVVTAGESLWSIAAGALPSDAGPQAITRESIAWYHRNRAVIGSDADLILPGQVLVSPEGDR
jgi:nucleoid-associated protein YgaU